MANNASLTLPSKTINVEEWGLADTWLGICVNLPNVAPSQYAGYNFNSMAQFGNVFLGASDQGIYSLDDAAKDDQVEIDALLEFVVDFVKAHLRSGHVGFEASGDLKITLSVDEGIEKEHTLTAIETEQEQHSGKFYGRRDQRGRYFKFKIENTDGADFSVDSIEVYPIYLTRKPAGS